MKDKLIDKLIKASNEISTNRKSKANYIILDESYIQKMSDEAGISYDEMVEIIKMKIMPNQ